MTEKILDLTLEIIYLLTGEVYVPQKKSSCHVNTISQSCVSKGRRRRRSKSQNVRGTEQKILEITNKIIELLRGEDVAVYLSMEEREYLDGHCDQYKAAMKEEKELPLTSPDGSRDQKSPVQHHHPHHPQSPAQEEPSPHCDYKDEDLRVIKCEPLDEEEETAPTEITSADHRYNAVETEETPEFKIEIDSRGGPVTRGSDSGPHSSDPGSDAVPHGGHVSYRGEWQEGSSHLAEHVPVEMMAASPRLFSCSECSKCFGEREDLINHQRLHTGERSFSSSERGKRGTEHQKAHAGERPYPCAVCGKCFSKKYLATRHKRSHTAEKSHCCPDCGKGFTSKFLLLTHMRSHGDEKPFPCPVCGKSFKLKSNVLKHQRLHSGERPYSCSVCGKNFSGKSNLNRHGLIHTGQKPHICSVCGKQFSQKTHLITHEYLHTGVKPFSCSVCGKRYSDKAIFVRHVKSHSEEKPYSCSECGKSFVQKCDLVKHERIHTGVKPYTCTRCGKSFIQKAHLIGHQRVHGAVK